MSSLIAKLQQHVSEADPTDIRAYRELLLLDDPQQFDALRSLMVKLQKPVDQLAADRAALLRVSQIRGIVGAGRAAVPLLNNAKKAVADFDAETKRINDERSAARAGLVGKLSTLLSSRSRAQDAIAELENIRAQHSDVLADEPAIDPAGLD